MVKLLLLFLLAGLALTGCNFENSQENAKGPTISQIGNDGRLPSDEDLITGARNEVTLTIDNDNANNNLSKDEARDLVKRHLNITDLDTTSVSFEGYEGNDYLFQVTDSVYFNNHPDRLLRGWYRVDPATGDVELVRK